MEGLGLEGVDQWIVIAVIFGALALLLVLLVGAKGRGGGSRSNAQGYARQGENRARVQVTCPTCQGARKVKRELPLMHQNALGVSNMERCQTCVGKGFILE